LYGVEVKHYHADNGIFAEKEFVHAVERDGQTISYCGVNAHHQNGKAEKKIRDLQDLARTMLLHAQQRWPSAITANLWPYAVRMANDVSNVAPRSQRGGVSPIELFSQVDVAPRVKHLHTFGSPAYVLDSTLQTAGAIFPKWKKKARVGIYLGTSPRHARSVALILNLSSGHVSPQFHVKYDDLFETLRPSAGNVLPESRWQAAVGLANTKKLGRRGSSPDAETAVIPESEQVHWVESGPPIHSDRAEHEQPTEGQHEGTPHETSNGDPTPMEAAVPDMAESPEPTAARAQPQVTTRSGRVSRPTTRWEESREQQREGLVALFVSWEVFHDGGYQIEDELDDPIAFVASTNPDIMYLDQAMREPDSAQFERAMIEEVTAHTDNDHWEVVRRVDVPKGTKVLPAVWAMRRKRRITTGVPYKWKARLNLHGGKQEHGVNYWETYAPVIAWSTIRLFLVIALLNKWSTRQVDFVLAYPQADIEVPMYMEIPKGFKFKGSRLTHCLLLKKNLYGQKQAGRVWNEYLHDGLIARGFVQSKVDMCLYYRGPVTLMIYTDDGILIGPTAESIDEVISLMQTSVPSGDNQEGHRAFKLTDEGDLCDYLGVKVEYLPNGMIKLSQPHLIQQIIDDLGFNERTKSKPTPAASATKLSRDLHGKSADEEWHYRSIVGKLNFVEKSTRLDLGYSVHQCARFSSDPKESHANAIKRIGKYLIGTKDKGLILNPKKHSFDCWVDADFVGNWERVNADVDPATAKSRTGFVVTYAGCPLVWASKLQGEVALSTTEAEYNAMSTSLREVIHLMQVVSEAKVLGWKTFTGIPTVHCKVYEDNSGALEMARLPKMRPRTKHLNVRMHHFRDHVRRGDISLEKVASEDQLADILTKPQPESLFVAQRETLMQWNAEDSALENVVTSDHLRACDINDDMEVTNEERSQQDPDVTREGKSDPRALVAISRDTPGEQLNAQSTYKRKKTVRITPSTMAKGQR
jgi:Reverse transcriptase (RNA-dependent DNA polymerase)